MISPAAILLTTSGSSGLLPSALHWPTFHLWTCLDASRSFWWQTSFRGSPLGTSELISVDACVFWHDFYDRLLCIWRLEDEKAGSTWTSNADMGSQIS